MHYITLMALTLDVGTWHWHWCWYHHTLHDSELQVELRGKKYDEIGSVQTRLNLDQILLTHNKVWLGKLGI